MTVVNPKSISGINSITTGSGSDDVLTIHNNNGTERLRVQSDKVMFSVDAKVDGDSTRDLGASGAKWKDAYVTTLIASSSAKVGSGVTLSSDGDIFATGVCTATSFSGDGSNLTGISAGVSLSNGSNNRIVTATGAAAITGESELTYDSGTLNLVPSSGEARILVIGGEGEDARISLTADDGDDHIDQYNIESRASDNSFRIDQFSGGSRVDRLSIDTNASGGNVTVHTGNLVIGTSGKGIDFSATDGPTNGSGTSELLDDYEEGTFTPTARGHNTNSSPVIEGSGKYTKIGRLVQITLSFSAENGSYMPSGEYFQIHGLPFIADGTHYMPGPGFNYKVVFNSDNHYLFYMPNNGTILWGYRNISDSSYQPWSTNDWDNTQWYHSNTFTYMTDT